MSKFVKLRETDDLSALRRPLETVLAHAWVNYETLLENCLVGFLVRD